MESIEIKTQSSACLTITISSTNNENHGRIDKDQLKPVFQNDAFRSEYVRKFLFKKEENNATFVSKKKFF